MPQNQGTPSYNSPGAYTSPLANYYAGFSGNPGEGTYQSHQPGNFGQLQNNWSPNQQASSRSLILGTPEADEQYTTASYGIFDQARYSNQQLFGVEEQLVQQASAARMQGVDAALAETDRMSQAGYQRARDFGTTAGAAADLSSIDSGMFTSSERFNAQRSVNADTFRQFLAVDEAYAGTRAALQQARGSANAQAYSDLANFYERVRLTNEDSYMNEFRARAGNYQFSERIDLEQEIADNQNDLAWFNAISGVAGSVAGAAALF